MRVNVKLLGRALVIALSAFAVATSAYATAIPETQTFSGTAFVTDTQTAGATTKTNEPMGSTSFSKFDPSGGVLTGVTIGVTSTRTQSLLGGSTQDQGNVQSASGVGGNASATVAVPGASQTFGSISIPSTGTTGTVDCTKLGNPAGGCSYSASGPSATTNHTFNVTLGSLLNSYVGLGTFDVTRTANLSATSSGTFNKHSATYTLGWTGSITTSYDYLYHATPSFDGASEVVTKLLDFGTQALSSGPVDLGFDVYNLLGIGDDGTVGLDLDSISCAGDCLALSTNLGTFLNPLAAGSSQAFTASFDTSGLGPFSATYILSLSDANVGAPNSRNNNYELTLELRGEVRQVAEPVPLPGTLSLLATGVGLLGAALRRRSS